MENDREVIEMRDCTTCKFDRLDDGGMRYAICAQAHHRFLELSDGGIKHLTVEDCHAWKEKEKCSCWNCEPSLAMTDLFIITCKKCGRKLE